MLSAENRKDNSKLEIIPMCEDNYMWVIMESDEYDPDWYNSGICGEAISLSHATVTSYLVYRDYLEGKSAEELMEMIKRASEKPSEKPSESSSKNSSEPF